MIRFAIRQDGKTLIVGAVKDGEAVDSLEIFPPEEYSSGTYEEIIAEGFGLLDGEVDAESLKKTAKICEVFFS